MRIGLNTYCFHRLLGDLRPGESPATERLADGGVAAVARARAFGCEVVGLQTVYLADEQFDASALRRAADGTRLVIEWGHPEGLAFGTRPAEEVALLDWLERAATLGTRLVRIVVGGPRLRGAEPVGVQQTRTVEPLRRCADRAAELGIDLAVENHVDLTTGQLAELLAMADRPNLGICLDPANAMRLGEDPLMLHDDVASLVRMVQLRDVEPLDNVSDPIAGPRTVPFGTGIVPLTGILGLLGPWLAEDAPALVEIAQIGPGDDELALIDDGLAWLRTRRDGRCANQT